MASTIPTVRKGDAALNYEEKRKMERFALELPAWISVTDEHGNQKTTEVITRNICAGGAYFKMDSPLPLGTNVDINMLLFVNKQEPEEGYRSKIEVSGQVIRTEEIGVAVMFDKRFHISPLGGNY